MNPSAPGWIQKHFPNFLSYLEKYPMDDEAFYKALGSIGFIYGHSVDTLIVSTSKQLKWTTQEKTKINLFDALSFTYYDTIESATQTDCIQSIVNFYLLLDKRENYFINIKIGSDSPQSRLEKIIHQRVQTNESTLQKNFSHLITNALAYIDILSFEHYLLTQEDPYHYAKNLESILTQSIWVALRQKEEKHLYNQLLIKLFESSVRYNTLVKETHTTIDQIDLSSIQEPLEKKYLLDLCSLSLWDDQTVDPHEKVFLMDLCKSLELNENSYQLSITAVKDFLKAHSEDISYLNYSNPVKHFYNQTTATVKNLISRNSKRLAQEISESGTLVKLLTQSTVRDLSKEERKLVKNQLLDICKSIPSLAIFLLPGGGILLPLLIKFIPKMLPSAFNENLED
ncbi:LETM1-related biofilm-associated protein [Dokdonia sp. Hel_I_53]|uniref:LETM1-related biofilm-associated protein n=1 Tax=Dokdonia sp. Hel_I_53 TaxID=1566287 RepID=UPI00119C2420|nr:LETM1-related biofilm-associated protein [Dokdonia sp. Hel_I_53]TVZ51140.1 LETM1-like protein [Dokdonia sp. Hel_I_53]